MLRSSAGNRVVRSHVQTEWSVHVRLHSISNIRTLELRIVIWDCEKVMTDLMGNDGTGNPDIFFVSFSDKRRTSSEQENSRIRRVLRCQSWSSWVQLSIQISRHGTLRPSPTQSRVSTFLIGMNSYLAESIVELEPIFLAASRSHSRVDRERAEIKLYHPDFAFFSAGRVCLLVTKSRWRKSSGIARDAPNNDPYLPPVTPIEKRCWKSCSYLDTCCHWCVLGLSVHLVVPHAEA